MEKKEVAYINKKNIVFLIALAVYLLTLAVEYTDISVGYGKELQSIRYISYGLCIVKMIMEAKYRKRETLFYAIILILAVAQSMVSDKRGMIFFLFFLLASYGVNIKLALKVQILVQSVCLIGVWILCFLGIFENLEFFRHGEITYSLGFSYVGFSGALFFAIEASWLYLRNKKITLAETMIFLLIWSFIYHFTDTRAATLLGIFMAAACYAAKFWKKTICNKFMKFICMMYYPFVTALIWGLQCYYNFNNQKEWMKRLNEMLSGRLELCRQAIETYGIKLLGSNITWITNMDNRVRNSYNYVDCTYFKVLFDFGVVVGVLFLSAYIYIMYHMWKNNELSGCIVLCVFSVLLFMTPIVGLNTNPLLLLAGGIFHGKAEVHRT